MMLLMVLIGEEDEIEPVPSPAMSMGKKLPAMPKGVSFPRTQRIPRLPVTATILNAKRLIKRVRKLIKTKRPRSTDDAAQDAHRGFGDNLAPVLSARIVQNAK